MATATTRKRTTAKSAADNSLAQFKNDDLSAEIAALKSDIAQIGDRLSSIASTGAQKARYHGEKAGNDAIDKTDELLTELNDQLAKIEADASSAVRRNPLQALGIAAGVGFLAAMVMRR